jgi:hypothetical protein
MPVLSMKSPRSHLLPLLLLPLCACSANAPTPGASSSVNARGTSPGLTAAPDVRETVRVLSSRAQENLEVSEGPVPGSRLLRIKEGFGEVIIGKTNRDGSVSTRCVDSAAGADAFLNNTSPSKPTRAAQ